MSDDSRWFDALGSCVKCGKPAHGKVRNSQNASMGNYCTKCGKARVREAQKAREKRDKEIRAANLVAYHGDIDGDFNY